MLSTKRHRESPRWSLVHPPDVAVPHNIKSIIFKQRETSLFISSIRHQTDHTGTKVYKTIVVGGKQWNHRQNPPTDYINLPILFWRLYIQHRNQLPMQFHFRRRLMTTSLTNQTWNPIRNDPLISRNEIRRGRQVSFIWEWQHSCCRSSGIVNLVRAELTRTSKTNNRYNMKIS